MMESLAKLNENGIFLIRVTIIYIFHLVIRAVATPTQTPIATLSLAKMSTIFLDCGHTKVYELLVITSSPSVVVFHQSDDLHRLSYYV